MMLLLCRDRGRPRGPYNTGTTHFLALACANTSGLQLRPGSLVTVDRHWHRDSCRRRLSSRSRVELRKGKHGSLPGTQTQETAPLTAPSIILPYASAAPA